MTFTSLASQARSQPWNSGAPASFGSLRAAFAIAAHSFDRRGSHFPEALMVSISRRSPSFTGVCSTNVWIERHETLRGRASGTISQFIHIHDSPLASRAAATLGTSRQGSCLVGGPALALTVSSTPIAVAPMTRFPWYISR